MTGQPAALAGHTCPGLCGRHLQAAPFACRTCERQLPGELRTRIVTTRWAQDWPANSAAMTEGMHHLAALTARRNGKTYIVHGRRVDHPGGIS